MHVTVYDKEKPPENGKIEEERIEERKKKKREGERGKEVRSVSYEKYNRC